MYAIEADKARRLLVISAAGQVKTAEVKAAAEKVREIVTDAAPGWRVLTDFRWLESMEPGSAHHIAEIMDALAAKEVASVARVVPDPHKDIGLNILSHFHYSSKIKIATFETLAEAIGWLMESDK